MTKKSAKKDEVTEVAEILKQHKAAENSDITSRHDGDMELLTEEFKLRYPGSDQLVPEIHNVTSSQPLIDFLSILGNLDTVSRQIDINGGMSDTERAARAEFFENLFISVDDLLSREFGWEWSSWVDQLFCLRGGVDARIQLREDDNGFVPDIMPCDIRYRTMMKGKDGILWWNYVTERDVEIVEDEYPGVNIRPGRAGSKKKKVPILDRWSEDKHIVIVDNNDDVVNEPNPYGFVPVVSQSSGLGLKLFHETAIEHNAESMFWENRDLYEVESEFMTLARNTHLRLFDPSTVGMSDDPETMGPDIDPQNKRFGGHVQLPPKTKIDHLLAPETFNLSTTIHRDILGAKMSRGGANDLDIGTSDREYSRFQITDQTEKKRKKIRMILKAKSMLMRQICRMVVMELDALKFSGKLKVGEYGAEKEYDLKKITGDYSIQVNYSINDPVMDLVNLETAQIQQGMGFSQDFINRQTMGVEDYDSEKAQREMERAEQADPILALFNLTLIYIDESKEADDEADKKARLTEKKLLPLIQQQAQQGQPQPGLQGAVQSAKPQGGMMEQMAGIK